MTNASKSLALEIGRIIDSKKGQDIKILDIQERSSFSDFFVIATGTSSRQVKAIADEIEDILKEGGVFLDHKEGYENGRWVLLDYLHVIVHIFHEEERLFYNIDRLWKDAPLLFIDSI